MTRSLRRRLSSPKPKAVLLVAITGAPVFVTPTTPPPVPKPKKLLLLLLLLLPKTYSPSIFAGRWFGKAYSTPPPATPLASSRRRSLKKKALLVAVGTTSEPA